jgi:hypothetical protein
MQSLANPSGSFSRSTEIWREQGKLGLWKGFKDRVAQGMTGEWDIRAMRSVRLLNSLIDHGGGGFGLFKK